MSPEDIQRTDQIRQKRMCILENSKEESILKRHIQYHLYVEPKKMIQRNLFSKWKQTHRLREQT